MFLALMGSKVAFLGLECVEKGRWQPELLRSDCPESVSGIINRMTFFWMHRLFIRGAFRGLSMDNLYDLEPEMKILNTHEPFLQRWKINMTQTSHISVFAVLVRALKGQIAICIIPRTFLLALNVSSPLLLNRLLEYLQSATEASDAGHILIAAFALVYIGIAISTSLFWYHHLRVLVLMRGNLVAAISQKIERMDLSSIEDSSGPVTLMSTDIERIMQGFHDFHDLWANTIQAACACYILQTQLGVAFVVPLVMAIICTALAGWLSGKSGSRQTCWMDRLQCRIGATSQMLSNIKFIKAKALEGSIMSEVKSLRAKELGQADRFRAMVMWTVGLGDIPEIIGPVATFLAFILISESARGPLDASKLFTSLSALQILTIPLSSALRALPLLASALECLGRIDRFLKSPERRNSDKPPVHAWCFGRSDEEKAPQGAGLHDYKLPLVPTAIAGAAIAVDRASFGYSIERPILKDITVSMRRGQISLVIGPSGCGKSTMCKALIGEVACLGGHIAITGAANGIAYCDQLPFLRNGSVRDNIVAFAPDSDEWYSKVCKACDLDEDIASMGNSHDTVIGSNGSRLSGGQKQKIAIARAVYSRKPLLVLDDVLSSLDHHSAGRVFQGVMGECGLARSIGASVVFATHSTRFLRCADMVVSIDAEGNSTIMDPSTQSLAVTEEPEMRQSEKEKMEEQAESSGEIVAPPRLAEDAAPISQQPGREKNNSVYRYYFSTVAAAVLLLICVSGLAVAALYTASFSWLKIWVDREPADTRAYYFWGVYAALQGGTLLFELVFIRFLLITFASGAGRRLHADLLSTVLNYPWPSFSKLDSGSVLNRFSQDLQLVDGELPLGLLNLILSSLFVIGQAIIIVIASPYVGITFPVIVLLLYGIQKFYLLTSRALRVMDLEAKSPLYTHFTETLNGLATIRAFGWAERNSKKLLQLLDTSQTPVYLLYMAQQWLTFVLDLIVACITIVIVTVSVAQRRSGAATGVALTQTISMSLTLRLILVSWTRVETSIAAVSRIKNFAQSSPAERQTQALWDLPAAWPATGKVEFKSVTAAYG